ncbi:pentatricopeptide repeat-containing protein At5g28460-like [Hibiscus syriacus]|uniref:pentatricopeptide repeat-containing protein At5g28460-like n=1 Tax=Hibiscus syriacus TaxID=106335 RepID=UPI001920F15A|nr:pentatricopeptide repeat-containing protein At5g28460-like [Hibiscus syriacus]
MVWFNSLKMRVYNKFDVLVERMDIRRRYVVLHQLPILIKILMLSSLKIFVLGILIRDQFMGHGWLLLVGRDRAIRNIDNIAKAVDLFDQMLSSGCSLHPKVCYSLISGLCKAGRMDDASNEMLEAGMKPDSVSYNSLITYFCKTEDFEIAGEVMKQMINQGVIPTTATYGALIQAYCSNGKIEDATKLFNDMSSLSKVPPNTLVYTSLIESLCKNNDIKGALSLMDDMKAKRVKPNTTTYNAVLKGLKKNNLLENAYGLMDGMIENACNPDCITMEILRELLSSVDGSKKLESFVQGKRVSPL